MDRQWLIIPEISQIEESVALAEEYNAAFEYNDFYVPSVYLSKERIEGYIKVYTELNRDRSRDTLHGAFIDLAPSSMDRVIRQYSRDLMEQSMEIGAKLGVRGVVFHSGLVPGVENNQYIDNWLGCMEDLFREFAKNYQGTEIYLENTVERIPDYHVALMQKMTDVKNVRLCLDYAHAVLTQTEPDEWVRIFAPYIGHMHLNDNDLQTDMHAVPGDESIDYSKMQTSLEKYDVNVPILLELRGIEAQRRALEYMVRC